MAIESTILIPANNAIKKKNVHFTVHVHQVPQIAEVATGWTSSLQFASSSTGPWSIARDFGQDEIVETTPVPWSGLESEYQIEALIKEETFVRVVVLDPSDVVQDFPTLPIFLHIAKIIALPVD